MKMKIKEIRDNIDDLLFLKSYRLENSEQNVIEKTVLESEITLLTLFSNMLLCLECE